MNHSISLLDFVTPVCLWDFGRNNRLFFTPIYGDDYQNPVVYSNTPLYWWLNGRIFGHYISVSTSGARKYKHP